MARPALARQLPLLWYRRRLAPALLPLLPVSWLFAALAALRRLFFRLGLAESVALPVPVIVVGNLTVGGSGKTPLTLWLVESLRAAGWQPGIISRGYGADAATTEAAREVKPDNDPRAVGDEPLLLARRSGVPVFVGRDRVAAGRALLAAHPACNVLVSDDGLQHYRLRRDVELVVFDARGAGNACLLPAGPLREGLQRLRTVTALVWNGEAQSAWAVPPGLPQFSMRLAGEEFVSLADPRRRCMPETLRGRRLHALAGIGDPARFFRQLTALGLEFSAHPFPDHHAYRAADLAFAQDGILLMTEKDAVKCAPIYPGEAWILPVAADVLPCVPADGAGLLDTILEKLNGRPPA